MNLKKKINRFSALLLIFVFAFSLLLPVTGYAADYAYFNDYAGIVSADQAAQLEQELATVSQNCDMDFAIYVDDDANIGSVQDTADSIFISGNYGVGSDRDGTLLYVNMATRDVYIATHGYGITAFTDDGITFLTDELAEKLGDEEYFDAFHLYIERCQVFTDEANAGNPYSGSHMPKEPYSFFGTLLISLVVGLIAAFIYTLILKGELKSVAPNDSAVEYAVPGSMHVSKSREFFLYKTVSRREKPKDNDSKSTTHTTSSGDTFGGGGRKF